MDRPASSGRRSCLPALTSAQLGGAASPAGAPDQYMGPGRQPWDPALLNKAFECAAKAFTPMGANWPDGILNSLTWMGPEETT